MVKILIVDDVHAIVADLAEVLELEGYEVLIEYNGRDGLEQAQLSLPDIIISDIEMPVMDGYQLLRALRRHEPTQNIPFIFMSGTSDDFKIRSEFGLPPQNFIRKPFNIQHLLSCIDDNLKHVHS